jgi:hypothetical protein
MLVSVEQFNNGNTYTVVYSDIVYTEKEAKDWNGGFIGFDLDSGAIRGYCKAGELYWTALPPLPSKPTADDAKLLHLYAAHSLMVWWTDNDEEKPMNCAWLVNRDMLHYNSIAEATNLIKRITITHALDEQGNRIEIALKD